MTGTVSAKACTRLSRNLACHHRTRVPTTSRTFSTSSQLHYGRPSPAYPGHIPLSGFENAFLTVGAGIMAFRDPWRGDMVAALGETTAGWTLPTLRDTMLNCEEGRRILRDRPRVNSRDVDLEGLKSFPDGTFGKEYSRWLEACKVTPDAREPVHYIDDPELAYVMTRYRETHDLYHALFALRVSALPELALKAFEFANLGFPMTGLALGASVRMKEAQRNRLWREFVPWGIQCGSSARCLMTVYWEERWGQDIQEIKKEIGVWDPPSGLTIRST